MSLRPLALAAAALGLCSCVVTRATVDEAPLAQPRVVSDFDTYRLRRVGVLPVLGGEYGEVNNDDLQAALHTEFTARAASRSC